VLYSFQAQIEGDLSVAEGEVVRIKEQHDAHWVRTKPGARHTWAGIQQTTYKLIEIIEDLSPCK
jgi:hypothetical protein